MRRRGKACLRPSFAGADGSSGSSRHAIADRDCILSDAKRIRTMVRFVACQASLGISPAVVRFRCLASHLLKRSLVVDFFREGQVEGCQPSIRTCHPVRLAPWHLRCSASALAFWAVRPLLSHRPFCWNSPLVPSHPAISLFCSPLTSFEAFGIHVRTQTTANCHPSPRSHVQPPFSPFGRVCIASIASTSSAAFWKPCIGQTRGGV